MTILKKLSLHPNALDCVTKAAKEDFCCCLWEGASVYEMNKNISDRFGRTGLKFSQSTTFFIDDGLVYQKRAIFRRHFDFTIWNAIQMGLVDKWIEMDMYKVRKARQDLKLDGDDSNTFNDEDGPQKLKVQQLVGGIVLILIGSVAGFMGVLTEILVPLWSWRKHKREIMVI
ncbi:uncharacterized protein LOC110845638 [Folsomia candida]|nr:uncharacterized protein LOC110845638 [Folsomia candida]